MLPFQQDQIERFLREHQPAIAGLLEQAYVEAGGHYAAMSPEQQHRQAAVDSGEYIAGLLRGTVERETVQTVAHQVNAAGIDLSDILRMSSALERRITEFIQADLSGQPVLAQEVIRRAHNVAASFRANLAAAQIDDSLRHLRHDDS